MKKIIGVFLISLSTMMAIADNLKISEYEGKLNASIEKIKAKYPESLDESTQFYKAFTPRFDDTIQSEDDVTNDPEWPFHLAETVAHQLTAKGVPIIIKELPEGVAAIRNAAHNNQLEFAKNQEIQKSKEETAPNLTKFEATLQRLANEKRKAEEENQQAPVNNPPKPVDQPQSEVQQYLDAVRRGEAGVDPKDQTSARSGEPYAAARIRHQMVGNDITRRLNKGLITPAQATIERAAASTTYQQELTTIEQQKLLEEMRRQNEELERMNRELERRRYQRR